MKKIFYVVLLLFSVILTSCENNEPEVIVHNSRIFMYVGDYVGAKVDDGKDVQIRYSESRNATSPVFEAKMQDDKENPILIHALNVGTDTLFVGYHWTAGTSAYGKESAIIVTVLDNK